MMGGPHLAPLFDFDAFGAAVGMTVVCGVLSVLVPVLVAPTATLAALALAGWVSIARQRGGLTRRGFDRGPVVALSILGGATIGFFVTPPILAPARGLLLAGGILPLYAFERIHTSFHRPAVHRT